MRPLYRGSSIKHQKGLKAQAAQKKKKIDFSPLWRILSVMGACLAKFSCLVIGLAVISLLFVYLYGCLLKSPYLGLEQIVVTGLEEEEQGELLESTGLQGQLSLLTIDLNELKENIEKRPWIRRVDLEKRFPHTLIIRVEREEAWALVVGEKLHYMNRWGEIFTEADAANDPDYPIVTGIDLNETGKQEQLMRAAEALGSLEKEAPPWSLKDLSELHVRKDGNISLYFSSLPMVIKIRGSELSARIDDLKKLVKHLQDMGSIHMVKGINLNYRDAAVVCMKKG